ncbi:LCCL domain-containing protein [[Limnothrix rosea] IAM M-220]|uniref:LCCL domain-containing protein n=1 Tax=[Limnothrix rosea] IAM M-220 TaxID=454133 RepID=UPI0009632E23|nr:LCCL domain-containing protein [[Limnothrix rosea] IAM M-220]OKH14158.1 hypothetical protein NIES208_14350 [[Limnothrix rosea] IAM M-220]
MKYSAALSFAAIATCTTVGIAVAHQQPSTSVSPHPSANFIAHHHPAEVITHHQPTESLSHHQPTESFAHHKPDISVARNSTINWDTAPNDFNLRGKSGQYFSFNCPPGNADQPVWGTDIYTDGSSICAAAVHAGHLDAQSGGNITLELMGSQNYYEGSDRHGIETNSYGSWSGSFRFVKATE